MKYIRIVKDTFIKGIPATKGQEFEVDDRTAVLLGGKAIEIDSPGGKKKEVPDGPLETFHIIRQQETVVRPVEKKEELELPRQNTARNNEDEKIVEQEKTEEKTGIPINVNLKKSKNGRKK